MDVTAKPAKGGKRERLIEGARQLIYRQGVERTTLADLAAQTDVPVGNIYFYCYYFKTKDDLLDAVVQAHSRRPRLPARPPRTTADSPCPPRGLCIAKPGGSRA